MARAQLAKRVGAQEPPRSAGLGWAGLAGEPNTAGNWHQMLPDLPHPPGSWKHLFV